MADYPAMPLWTDAYLADTRHLNRPQHGSYFLLMMEAWRRPNCDLPDDDTLLARLAGCSAEEWETDGPVIMAMWKLNKKTQTWTQKRLLKERQYVARKTRIRRDAAAKRWKQKKKGDANAMQTGMQTLCKTDAPTPTPTPTPTIIEKEKPSVSPKSVAHPLPEPWEPDADLMAFAKSEVGLPMATIIWENGKFIDYWRGKATVAAGRKSDWPATWRNWMRKASENKESLNGANRKPAGRRTVHDTFADLEGDIAAGFAEGNT